MYRDLEPSEVTEMLRAVERESAHERPDGPSSARSGTTDRAIRLPEAAIRRDNSTRACTRGRGAGALSGCINSRSGITRSVVQSLQAVSVSEPPGQQQHPAIRPSL